MSAASGLREQVIRRLADGEVHSGAEIAAGLGISRSAVWKHVRQLGEFGLAVQAVAGLGYRLNQPLELLERDRFIARLHARTLAAIESLELASVIDSTSAQLLATPAPAPGALRVCFAEFQTRGRGRRGRRWLSPYGSGICLSVSWCFDHSPRDLPALSLAAGVAVQRALVAAGASGLMLKWPNDVVHEGRKLAGVLVDVSGESAGPLMAVIGVGINMTVPAALLAQVGSDGSLAPVGLDRAVSGAVPSRHMLAAGLLDALYEALVSFSSSGFEPFLKDWRRYDGLAGRAVTVTSGAEQFCGVAAGISPVGALLVRCGTEVAAVLSGEVTVRPVA
jgi:BirA family biotin operon repressor/biotin-[acetyl-CoA-carboxylase] ligase